MNILRNVSIGVRLGIGFAIILLFSMLITGISVWRLHDVAADTRAVIDPKLQGLKEKIGLRLRAAVTP